MRRYWMSCSRSNGARLFRVMNEIGCSRWLLRVCVAAAAALVVVSVVVGCGGRKTAGAARGRILFVSERAGNPEVYVMNADGSGVQRLTRNPSDDFFPAWSPDGAKIAWARTLAPTDGQIHVMNLDDSDDDVLASSPADDESPSWSPDGRKIAFYSDRDGDDEIFVMNADGS